MNRNQSVEWEILHELNDCEWECFSWSVARSWFIHLRCISEYCLVHKICIKTCHQKGCRNVASKEVRGCMKCARLHSIPATTVRSLEQKWGGYQLNSGFVVLSLCCMGCLETGRKKNPIGGAEMLPLIFRCFLHFWNVILINQTRLSLFCCDKHWFVMLSLSIMWKQLPLLWEAAEINTQPNFIFNL